MNLSKVLDRQKEKLEAMRAFSTWRVQHSQAKEEVRRRPHAAKVAAAALHLQLKRRGVAGLARPPAGHWKDQVDRACRARAEEVCERLSADYEAQDRAGEEEGGGGGGRGGGGEEEEEGLLCWLNPPLPCVCNMETGHAGRVIIATLWRTRRPRSRSCGPDRERYGESVKTAFMRGVCALNMEAMSMFHPAAEGLPEPPAAAGTAAHHHHLHHHQHDAPPPPPPDERGSSSLAQQPWERPVSSSRFDPVHFDPPSDHPSHGEAGFMLGSSAPVTRPEASTTGAGGRVTTTVVGHQRPSKTVTARVSARPDLGITRPGRGGASSLHVMSMTPPMSSVIVERHQPVAQLNIGQSAAVSKHVGHHSLPTATRGQSAAPSRGHAHPSTCHMHSIKVVE
ncbi:hypothetical protein CRUP_029931 [Coryphaenoides rupestris]|nr:hypothetical protein CRUP_029931 [Coryphaenoides rupestris]